MALDPGARLGPYEILAPLGAGGMGEVYRARDTRLGRDVAIKVLPEHLSAQPDVRARFEREARAISALNHPNICVLHDVGCEGDTDYIVLELVDGETLAVRLERGALPLAEALRAGAQIADALARAHRAGIVHRDLKPGNVMLTKTGAKLMDFGLARVNAAAAPGAQGDMTIADLSRSPTMTSPLTAAGAIVGTFQYMAPEQLEGGEPDVRSDIWALGATLYEMMTGAKAFRGKTQASLISSIMKDEPRPIVEAAPLAPPALDRLVARCLAKDPDDRWQSVADVASELRWLANAGADASTSVASAHANTPPLTGARSRAAWRVAAAGWFVALAALAWTLLRPAPRPVERPFYAAIPASADARPAGVVNGPIALSPDGGRLASAVRSGGNVVVSIYDFATGRSAHLESTKGAGFPFWSADGRWIAFFADEKLKKVPASGGPAQTLADAHAGRGGSWNAAGTIIFAPDIRGPLMKISENGGDPTPITQPAEEEITHRNPTFLPDGEHFFFIERKSRSEGVGRLMLGSLDGDAPREILDRASNAYCADGYLFFVRERSLLAQRFDPRSLALEGAITPIAENLSYYNPRDVGDFSVSMEGTIAYRCRVVVESAPAILGRDGRLIEMAGPSARYSFLVANRDMKRIAFTLPEPGGQRFDVWVLDVATKQMQRATFTNTPSYIQSVFSPDATRLAVSSGNVASAGRAASLLWIQPVSGARNVETLLETSDFSADDWSPDGSALLGRMQNTETGHDVFYLRLDNPRRELRSLVATGADEISPRFSPNGQWVLYLSAESGRTEAYVTDFPNAAGKWQISHDGATEAIWSTNGREIYYRHSADSLMAVPVVSESAVLEIGTPVLLGVATERVDEVLASDGERFLALLSDSDVESPPAYVIRNWAATLDPARRAN
ncbi:MAG: protein kinase domain-containing protein [bacterium]